MTDALLSAQAQLLELQYKPTGALSTVSDQEMFIINAYGGFGCCCAASSIIVVSYGDVVRCGCTCVTFNDIMSQVCTDMFAYHIARILCFASRIRVLHKIMTSCETKAWQRSFLLACHLARWQKVVCKLQCRALRPVIMIESLPSR